MNNKLNLSRKKRVNWDTLYKQKENKNWILKIGKRIEHIRT